VSDPTIKESRAKALEDLAKDDRFIWEPPVYKVDDEGNIMVDDEGNQIIEKYARDPFTGPYVRNALQFLFLEDSAEWKKLHIIGFTAPQIAFTVTLVSINISGYYGVSQDIINILTG
jgi:hypothetical protein